MAAASLMAAAMVIGGLWYNARLDRVVEEKEALVTQLKALTPGDAKSVDQFIDPQFEAMAAPVVDAVTRVNEQRLQVLSHLAGAPGASTNLLLGTERSARAVGMVVTQQPGDAAILTALNLSPLPQYGVYKVWLVKGASAYSVGEFTVDSTGFGQTVIKLLDSLGDYDYILITVGSLGRGSQSLGESVLKGDL
jgi:hypothetical protein